MPEGALGDIACLCKIKPPALKRGMRCSSNRSEKGETISPVPFLSAENDPQTPQLLVFAAISRSRCHSKRRKHTHRAHKRSSSNTLIVKRVPSQQ